MNHIQSNPFIRQTGASLAAEEDKQHQQGGDFKASRDHRGRREDSYLDSAEGSVDPRDRDRDSSRDGGAENEEDFSREDRSLIKTGLSTGPGQLIGSEGSSGAAEAEVGADPKSSLGTGVIEDLSSFSPFRSLFVSASVAHEEKASTQMHTQSSTLHFPVDVFLPSAMSSTMISRAINLISCMF